MNDTDVDMKIEVSVPSDFQWSTIPGKIVPSKDFPDIDELFFIHDPSREQYYEIFDYLTSNFGPEKAGIWRIYRGVTTKITTGFDEDFTTSTIGSRDFVMRTWFTNVRIEDPSMAVQFKLRFAEWF